MSISELRRDYARESLDERDVDPNPIVQFERWFHQARTAELLEPNAMALATADAKGVPSVRMVLLKGADADGFVFFTNYESHKGKELAANPRASLCFWWDALQRQVRVSGSVTQVSPAESQEYFQSRPHGSQVGAWASRQSSVLASREQLELEMARLSEQYPEGSAVPLPPTWGGYRLSPDSIEFWQGRQSRLHDRIAYERTNGSWTILRLSP